MWNFKNLFAAPKTRNAETSLSGQAKVEGHIGHRRSECYWEPIFNQNLELDPEHGIGIFSAMPAHRGASFPESHCRNG